MSLGLIWCLTSYLPRSRPWTTPIDSWCGFCRPETCRSSSVCCRCPTTRPDWSGCCYGDWSCSSERWTSGWKLRVKKTLTLNTTMTRVLRRTVPEFPVRASDEFVTYRVVRSWSVSLKATWCWSRAKTGSSRPSPEARWWSGTSANHAPRPGLAAEGWGHTWGTANQTLVSETRGVREGQWH